MRHWFLIDRDWAQRRDALFRACEDRIIREARDRATGEERTFLDALLRQRERNAGRTDFPGVYS